ncbi:MAG: tetratricopeptide repeat protein [Geminicoccaceae bacterium]
MNAGEDLRQERAAVLIADVVGYSRHMARNEQATIQGLSNALDLFGKLIKAYGGRIVDLAGDGIFAVFAESVQALDFAVEAQIQFRDAAIWHVDQEPFCFRIGVNYGEVTYSDDRILGHSVNIAARIQELAEPGGVCISDRFYDQVKDDKRFTLHDLGPRRLKNIKDPVRVYAVETIKLALRIPPVPVSIEEQTPTAAYQARLAVLPFRNLTNDPADEQLCSGIAADLISNLSRFRDLHVIARHSSFQFQHSVNDPVGIGRQLDVRYLFLGGLQRSGARLRVRTELIEIESGRTVWSEKFNCDMCDVFDFQDDVADTVAARLVAQISELERRRAFDAHRPELRAYGLILRAQDLGQRYSRTANLHARRLFEQATLLDPDFSRAYAGLSRTVNIEFRYRWEHDEKATLERAMELANAAIAHDSLDARGYSELAHAQLFAKDHDAALAAYGRAIELNPNDADILAEMGCAVANAGDPQRAVHMLERALKLNPFPPDWYYWFLGNALFDQGNYKEALKSLGAMQDKTQGLRLLAATHALTGDLSGAKKYAQQLLQLEPGFTLGHWQHIPPDRNPEPTQRLIEGLRMAGLR